MLEFIQMKPHNLRQIVDEIIYKTGMTQEEIANKIGYQRPYFNTVINNPTMNAKKVEGRLKAEFPEIVNPMYKVTTATSMVVKSTPKDDELKKRVDDLERRLQEIEAQLKLIISLLRK